MKKSPNKYKYSVVDPGGFFEKNKVKPIMNESDATAFKMKGFPQHAGVSPMRQNEENEGTKARKRYNRIKKKHKEKRDNPTIVESSKYDVALDERIQEKTTRENIK